MGANARGLVLVVAWMVLAGILIGAGELVDHSGAVQGFDNHVTSFVAAPRAAAQSISVPGSWSPATTRPESTP
jgi:hypothetical protein